MTEFFKGDRVRLIDGSTQVMNVVEIDTNGSYDSARVRFADSIRPYQGWYSTSKLELVHDCSTCGISNEACNARIQRGGAACCPACHYRDTHQLLTPDGSRKRGEPQITGIAVDDQFYVNRGEPTLAVTSETARVTKIEARRVTFLSGVGYTYWVSNFPHIANCIKFYKEHPFEEEDTMNLDDTNTSFTRSYTFDPNRGVTIVTIKIGSTEYTGSAKTAPKEHFNPKIGGLLAEARALDSISSKLKHEANNLAGEKLTD